MIKNTAKSLLTLISLLGILLISCQKEIDIDLENPPPIPDGVKDSTFLIKSIAWLYDDGADSIVEHYSYDTLNKKIILNWTDSGTDPADPGYQSEYNNSKAELSYNDKGLLVHVEYTYPPSYVPWEYDYSTTDIIYDNENILQKIVVTYMGGSTSSREFNKTMLPGSNYRLQWEEFNPAIPDDGTTFRTAEFTADHKNILNLKERIHSVSNVDYKYSWKDSLINDAAGNVQRIMTHVKNESANIEENYISEEFTGRQSKGDQLHNQRNLILNGIADIPFGDNDEMISYAIGILTFQMDYEAAQYSGFPVKGARVRLLDGSFENFQSVSVFDSKDRLTKFTAYYVDSDIIPLEYKITYYK